MRERMRTAASIIGLPVFMGAILFGLSGTFAWAMGWLYISFYVVLSALMSGFWHTREDLARERKTAFGKAKPWDKILLPLIALIVPMATVIVSALDHRWGWSSPLPLSAQLAFYACSIVGTAITYRAMTENDFFSSVVRIQSDRGQRVVDSGPYRWVRHPGYVGAILYNLSVPLALGSLWAAGLGVLEVGLFVLRTALEDRALQAELPGYRDYAERTRYRLLPFVW